MSDTSKMKCAVWGKKYLKLISMGGNEYSKVYEWDFSTNH